MSNPTNEFAQQLEALFNDLQNVLQQNLADTITKDDLHHIATRIRKIEQSLQDIVNHVNELEKRAHNFDDKLMRLNQKIDAMQQSAARAAPQPQPQVVHMPQRIVVAEASMHAETHQFGGKAEEILIPKGKIVAGREITKENKKYMPHQAHVIDANEYTRLITTSQYYKESNQQSETFIKNAIDLLHSEHAGIIAIQTCILIDIRNMTVFENVDYLWYVKFIKKPNQKTVGDLQQLFLHYGLPEDLLSFEYVQHAIEQLAGLPEDQLLPRIKDINSKIFIEAVNDFRTKIIRTINDRK